LHGIDQAAGPGKPADEHLVNKRTGSMGHLIVHSVLPNVISVGSWSTCKKFASQESPLQRLILSNPSSTHPKTKNSKVVKAVQKDVSPQTDEYNCLNVNSPAATNSLVVMYDQPLSMEVDKGSAVSEHTFTNN